MVKKILKFMVKPSFVTILVDGVLVTLASWLVAKTLDSIDEKINKNKKEDRVIINAEVVELNTK